jgi:tetratricopeptide (TPR) repeat protein
MASAASAPTTARELPAAAREAARSLVHGDDEAGAALAELVRRDADAVLDALALVDDGAAQVARLRCTLGLRYRRDARAVSACAAFGQRFPDDPAARALAFGAGGLAEELGLLPAAVDAYSRVIVLSPLVGATWHDALFARARARAALGDLDEASGDLRIYLRQNPSAASSDDVVALMRTLRWPR